MMTRVRTSSEKLPYAISSAGGRAWASESEEGSVSDAIRGGGRVIVSVWDPASSGVEAHETSKTARDAASSVDGKDVEGINVLLII